MSDDATALLRKLGEQLLDARFPPLPSWRAGDPDRRSAAEELVRLGLVERDDASSVLRLTDAGRALVDFERGVVAYCPKCSSAEVLARGLRDAEARCQVCGVTWSEDTAVEPFVPKY